MQDEKKHVLMEKRSLSPKSNQMMGRRGLHQHPAAQLRVRVPQSEVGWMGVKLDYIMKRAENQNKTERDQYVVQIQEDIQHLSPKQLEFLYKKQVGWMSEFGKRQDQSAVEWSAQILELIALQRNKLQQLKKKKREFIQQQEEVEEEKKMLRAKRERANTAKYANLLPEQEQQEQQKQEKREKWKRWGRNAILALTSPLWVIPWLGYKGISWLVGKLQQSDDRYTLEELKAKARQENDGD